jgi:hypothetical protein
MIDDDFFICQALKGNEPVQKAAETRNGRSKAGHGSGLKSASREVRRIGNKISLNEAETLVVGIAG